MKSKGIFLMSLSVAYVFFTSFLFKCLAQFYDADYFIVTEGPPVIADEWEVTVRWHPRRGITEGNLTIAVPQGHGGRLKLETGYINLSRNFEYEGGPGYGAKGHKLWLFASFPHWLMSEFIEVLYERDLEEDPNAPSWMELYNISIVPFKSDANPLDWKWTYCPSIRPAMLEENIWLTLSKPLCEDYHWIPLPGLFNEFPDWTKTPLETMFPPRTTLVPKL